MRFILRGTIQNNKKKFLQKDQEYLLLVDREVLAILEHPKVRLVLVLLSDQDVQKVHLIHRNLYLLCVQVVLEDRRNHPFPKYNRNFYQFILCHNFISLKCTINLSQLTRIPGAPGKPFSPFGPGLPGIP